MRKIRFGMLGFGEWANWHACFIRENPHAELVAVADNDKGRCRKASQEFNAQTYSDYRELIKREELDIVDILLPNYLHQEATIAALRAGNNVLLEKPMGVTVEECDSTLQFLREIREHDKDLFLAIGFELRASSLWGKIKEIIRDGKIGTVRAVNLEVFRAAPSVGAGSWRLSKDKVGSWMLDAPIHYFDLIRWFFEKNGEPQSIYSSANSFSKKALVDNFASIVNFPHDSYALLSYTMAGYGYYTIAKVIGDKGSIWGHWEEDKSEPWGAKYWLQYDQNGTRHEVSIDRPAGETFDLKAEIDWIVKVLQHGGSVHAEGEDGKEAVRICLAADESLNSGKIVHLR